MEAFKIEFNKIQRFKLQHTKCKNLQLPIAEAIYSSKKKPFNFAEK